MRETYEHTMRRLESISLSCVNTYNAHGSGNQLTQISLFIFILCCSRIRQTSLKFFITHMAKLKPSDFIAFITIICDQNLCKTSRTFSTVPLPPDISFPLSETDRPSLTLFPLLPQFILFILVQIRMQKEIEKPYEKHHTTKEKVQGLRYCRAIKEFLQVYKTKKCGLNYEHSEQLCYQFHSQVDRRRNPYLGHSFLYYPTTSCNCDRQKCSNYHSPYERNFHPLAYKTQKCANYYDCSYKLQCFYLHAEDQLHFQLGEYFRFDINLFKTKPCPRKEPHERKVCLYYHNDKDKRRPNFQAYSHIPCSKSNCNCQKSHNKIEQLYHPSRYKSKFCQTYGDDVYSCEYRDFCSFAHTKDEITIELIDEANQDPNYKVYNYKTVWCPYTLQHDRGNCPYAHNIQDYRRNPKDFKYLPEKCEAWSFTHKIESIEEGGCKAGMNCNKCHGWMEQRYHPQVYLATTKKGAKSYMHKDQMIKKKLDYSKRPGKPQQKDKEKEKEKNIEAIALKEIVPTKPAKYAVGAPFFKSQRQNSQASKKTNAKTGNMGSEDKSCNEDEKETRTQNTVVGAQLVKKMISTDCLQEQMWQFNAQSEPQANKSQTRSKSQGNSSDFVPSYSHTIKDMLSNQSGLMDKLVKMKVNEINLISADQKKINNMSFLNPKEKQKLVNKLKEYSLRKDIGFIEYSKGLTHFFVRNKADSILQKLRNKKIAEPKILKLQSRQSTKELSFLSQNQKEMLPRLLKKYKEEVQFGSIMNSVEQFTKDHDFNNDK